MRLYCGQQRGTYNPVSCDIAPLKVETEYLSRNKSERKGWGDSKVFMPGFIREKDEAECFNRLKCFYLGSFPEDEDRERFNKTTIKKPFAVISGQIHREARSMGKNIACCYTWHGKGLSQLQVVTGLFSPIAEYLREGIKKGFGIGFRLEASCWCSKKLALWREETVKLQASLQRRDK